MKVTIDSSESLQDALRVIGALYNRELTVAEPVTDAKPSAVDRSAVDGASAAVARAADASEESAVPAPKKASSRRRKAATTTKPKTSRRATKSAAPNRTKRPALPSTAELRAWAQANGQRVSDRGRVSSAVVAAYQEAHQG